MLTLTEIENRQQTFISQNSSSPFIANRSSVPGNENSFPVSTSSAWPVDCCDCSIKRLSKVTNIPVVDSANLVSFEVVAPFSSA